MHNEDDHRQSHEDLDYLLDCSGFSEGLTPHGHCDFSLSKDKLNLTEKERTREQSYEDVCKQIHQAKLQHEHLKTQLETLKQHTYHAYLGPFREEFEQLNHQNIALRGQLNQCRRRAKQDKSEKLSNRSSFKARTSINSVYGDENKKTHTKPGRNQASPNMILKRKQVKITESTTNLGRSQVISPRHHRKRESQLTERKIEGNCSVGPSVDASYYEEKASEFNIKESVSKQDLRETGHRNVFVEMLEQMLVEERLLEQAKYGELFREVGQSKPTERGRQDVAFIGDLEQEIKTTNQKLQIVELVVNRYQSEIQGINLNLRNVEDMNTRLFAVKGRYVQMQKRCGQLGSLREEVTKKQALLGQKKAEQAKGMEQSKSIHSVQTLIKIVANNPSKNFSGPSSSLYCSYYRELKELFKPERDEVGRRQGKAVKVRELIDTIRQGRRKFNELIGIYEGRIGRLEEKLGRVRGEGVGQSGRSGRK